MAWLNLNNSINSLKGQITNLATDLLSEGIIQSSDVDENIIIENDSRLQELENLVCAQKTEIETLKEQNEELSKKLFKNNELLQDVQVSNIQQQQQVQVQDVSVHESTTTRTTVEHDEHEWTMFDNDFEEDINNINWLLKIPEELNEDCLLTTDKLVTLRDTLQQDFNKIQSDYNQLIHHNQQLQQQQSNYENENELKRLKNDLDFYKMECEQLRKNNECLFDINEDQKQEINNLNELHDKIQLQNKELKQQQQQECIDKDVQTDNIDSDNINNELYIKLKNDYDELLKLINLKHVENVGYHTEIQRLNTIILDKNNKEEQLQDKNDFLEEKCNKLTIKLLDEQSKLQQLHKELERLREHLLNIEETHTQEMLENDLKLKELQNKLMNLEQHSQDSTSIYTSISIRYNQQIETLQKQIQLSNQERDQYQQQLSILEDQHLKQSTAITNLQCVLEQFQKDKEKDIIESTLLIRNELNKELENKNDLLKEIDLLKSQLYESKQGLKAATRLQEQLEKARHQVCTYQDQIEKLNAKITTQEELSKELTSHAIDKVDKTLIKNLFMGYLQTSCTNPKYHQQNMDTQKILKIIGTVLDFNQTDYEKIYGGSGGSSWYQTIMKPTSRQQGADLGLGESLSEAFIKFLENESRPKPTKPPLLLVNNNGSNSSRKNSTTDGSTVDLNPTSSNSMTSSSTAAGSLLLNDVLLPTFEDFAHTRSSSSILKDVLNNK
ncbi:thyroid receptor-interacting protein 11-like [Chrysoperla carnea]|uniref:thyroid receptor-interacting protein 11-like n=1 Tax=Chrysoperla carnea TaxID=189513 RepID=UPI001D08D15A|nr:thyroid receptor-interacting protein 11-like [Chrysoperla carnea]